MIYPRASVATRQYCGRGLTRQWPHSKQDLDSLGDAVRQQRQRAASIAPRCAAPNPKVLKAPVREGRVKRQRTTRLYPMCQGHIDCSAGIDVWRTLDQYLHLGTCGTRHGKQGLLISEIELFGFCFGEPPKSLGHAVYSIGVALLD